MCQGASFCTGKPAGKKGKPGWVTTYLSKTYASGMIAGRRGGCCQALWGQVSQPKSWHPGDLQSFKALAVALRSLQPSPVLTGAAEGGCALPQLFPFPV